jgi:hypothetical protein
LESHLSRNRFLYTLQQLFYIHHEKFRKEEFSIFGGPINRLPEDIFHQRNIYSYKLIKETPDQAPWRGSFVYGEPRVENRHRIWDLIRNLCGEWDGPWLVMCDFNEAMWQHEHFSETPRSERQMMDFREVLSHCDLHDLGFAGLPWTYNNNRDGAANVRVRLDRAVANTEWSDVFPDACVRHIGTVRSDHKLLLLRLQDGGSHARGNMTFHYEIMWEREEGLNAVVERSWNSRRAGDDLGSVAASLQRLTEELKIWSKNNFGQVTKKIEELREEMEQLEREDPIQKRAQVLEKKAQLDEHLYRR